MTPNKKLLVSYLAILILIPVSFYVVKQIKFSKPQPIQTPEIRSIITFNSKKEEILKEEGFITGKGIPNSKVSLTLSPEGESKELLTGRDGNFSYKLPSNLKPKNYNLTLILKDTTDNLASIKTYKVKLDTSASVHSNLPEGLVKTAHAQSNQCSRENKFCQKDQDCNDGTQACGNAFCLLTNPTGGFCKIPPTPSGPKELEALGPEYLDWVSWMNRLNIYPAKDSWTGEIVFVNREEFEKQVCNGKRCTQDPKFDEYISQIKDRNLQFVQYLGDYIRKQCYIPADVMQPYFPDLMNIDTGQGQFLNFFSENDFPSLKQIFHDPWPTCGEVKHEATENELGNMLTSASNQYAFSKDDPFQEFYKATEVATLGFLPTSTALKLFALTNGYKADNQLVADTAFAIGSMIPASKVPVEIRVIAHKTLNSRTAIQLMYGSRIKTIRNAIEASEKIPKAVVENEVAQHIEDIPISASQKWKQLVLLFPDVTPIDTYSWLVFKAFLEESLKTGDSSKVWQLSEFVTNKLGVRAISFANDFIARTGRYSITLNPLARDALDHNRIFIVNDELFGDIYRNLDPNVSTLKLARIGGFQYGDMIIIRESANNEAVLEHEIWHLLEPRNISNFGMGYTADDPLAVRSLNLIYEIMHDYVADTMRGVTPFSQNSLSPFGYSFLNRGVAQGIYDRLIKKYPELLDDFIEFSITRDGPKLIVAIAQKTGGPHTVAEFLRWFKYDVRLDAAVIGPVAGGITSGVVSYTVIAGKPPLIDFIQNHIQVEPNIFLDQDAKQNVTITSVEGEIESGNTLNVSALITENGIIEQNPQDFKVTYSLEKVETQSFHIIPTVVAQESTQLQINGNCLETCSITLPENLEPGEYKLVATLSSKDSDQVLDNDFENITLKEETVEETPEPSPNQEPKKVIMITLDEQLIWSEDEGSLPLNQSLDSQRVFTLWVYYSDSSSKPFSLTFEQLSRTEPPPPPAEPNQPPEQSVPPPATVTQPNSCDPQSSGPEWEYRGCADICPNEKWYCTYDEKEHEFENTEGECSCQ